MLIYINMIYLSAQDMSDTHFVVIHYRSEMVSGEKVGFQQNWVSRKRSMRILWPAKN